MMDKKEAMEKYEIAKKNEKVDKDIISLLDKINSIKGMYTTSSCSGRIVLLNIPEIGSKKGAKFIGKWHTLISSKDITESLELYEKYYLFLIMQSPIIHVIVDDFKSAKKLIEMALQCGFKYTTIKNIENSKILIEVLSTENLHIPLGKDGKIIIGNADQIDFFVEMANKMLARSKRKLKCLEEKISCFPLSFS